MDKNTLSHYGWIVVLILILSVMIAFAGPFGHYIEGAIWSTTEGLVKASELSFESTGFEFGENQNGTGTEGGSGNTNNESEDDTTENIEIDSTSVNYTKNYEYADSDWNFIHITTGDVVTQDVVVYLGGMHPTDETLNNSIYEFNGNVLTVAAENMTPNTEYILQFKGGNNTNTPNYEQIYELNNSTSTAHSIYISKSMRFAMNFSCMNEEGTMTEFIPDFKVDIEFSNGENYEMTTNEYGEVYIENVYYSTDGVNIYDTISANIKVYNTNGVLVFETTIDDLVGNYGLSYELDRSVLTAN